MLQLFAPANIPAVAHDHDYMRLCPEDQYLQDNMVQFVIHEYSNDILTLCIVYIKMYTVLVHNCIIVKAQHNFTICYVIQYLYSYNIIYILLLWCNACR